MQTTSHLTLAPVATTAAPRRTTAHAFLATIAAVTVAAGIAGCNDITGVEGTYLVVTDTLAVNALNLTPAGLPAAISFAGVTSVGYAPLEAYPEYNDFDLAFVLEADGRVRLYPAQLVRSDAAASVGVRGASGTFEALTRASPNEYTTDSALVVAPGAPVTVRVASALCSASSVSTYAYGKLVVDSATAEGRVYVRATINPNCGYRSLVEGVTVD